MLRLALLAPVLLASATGWRSEPVRVNLASTIDLVDLAVPPAAVAGGDASSVAQQADDGLFYIQADVNGTPVRFVVDTGASVVVLSGADAARAGVHPGGSGVSVETAGGSTGMHRATIGNVGIAGQTIRNVEAAVMPRGLEVSLLGQSVLSKLQSVTLKGGRMQLN